MLKRLYLKNPQDTLLGRQITTKALQLINTIGFEAFTFKKLALNIKTTEASVYRYFENKHHMLLYLVNQYWTHIYNVTQYHCQTEPKAKNRIQFILKLILNPELPEHKIHTSFDINALYQLVLWEGSKTYLTRNVNQFNKNLFFKPFKELSLLLAREIKIFHPTYKFSKSLASTLLEMAHLQHFYSLYLPSLTDAKKNQPRDVMRFLNQLLNM